MVININVPTTVGGSPRGAFTGTPFQTLLGNDSSKVDVLRFGNVSVPGAPNAVNAPAFSLPRFTKRIAESIALYMPSGLVYNSQNKYEEISMTAIGGKVS